MTRFPIGPMASVAVIVAATIVSPIQAAIDATCAGTLKINGKSVALAKVVAYSYPALDPAKRNISVLLSDRAPDEKAFRAGLQIGPGEVMVPGLVEGAWLSMHLEKALQGFTITFGPDRTGMTNLVLVGGQDKTFTLSTYDLTIELTKFDERIAGRIRTAPEELELPDYKVALDVTFDSAVMALPK